MVALLLVVACRCGTDEKPPEPSAAPSAPPRRLAVLAPGLADIVVRLDLAPRIVATSDECRLPEGHPAVRVGSLAMPDYDALARAAPDIVLCVHNVELEQKLSDRGIECMTVSIDSLQLLLDAVRKVGERLGADSNARALERDLLDQIDRTRKVFSGLPAEKVLFVLGPAPHWVAGFQSIYQDMIHFSGAINAASGKAARLYPLVHENVEAAEPDAIVVALNLAALTSHDRARELRYWRRFDVPASRTGRVILVDETDFLAVGPRSLDAWVALAHALHPGVLAKAEGAR